jgi:hypothetical protein
MLMSDKTMTGKNLWRFFFNNMEKEEVWLNEMASKGLNLVVPGKLGPPPFRFEQGTPGEWIYRIEFLPATATSKAGRRYLEFVAETGAETVHASAHAAYFRKRAADGPFEIFSDLDSRIANFRRLRRWLVFLAVPQLLTIAAMTMLIMSPGPDDAPLLIGLVVVLLLSLVVEAMAIGQVVRESRRIKSLAARKTIFE